ncbi:EF-hand domain-containing protein [Sphingomonas changnyeongensis]|nr:histidine kinase [Sphingomonas changnyeongensis]
MAGMAALALALGAGFVWWSGREERAAPLVPASAPQTAAEAGLAEPLPPEASERTREQRRFDRYDRDRDGIVVRDEYLASRVKAFRRLDTDGDGRLSFEEWADKTIDRFATADADRDQKLTRTEFATTRPPRRAPPRTPCPPPAEAEGG